MFVCSSSRVGQGDTVVNTVEVPMMLVRAGVLKLILAKACQLTKFCVFLLVSYNKTMSESTGRLLTLMSIISL